MEAGGVAQPLTYTGREGSAVRPVVAAALGLLQQNPAQSHQDERPHGSSFSITDVLTPAGLCSAPGFFLEAE